MWGGTAALLAGCAPDLHDAGGVLGVLAEGCGKDDAAALFPALDETSRHALDAIVTARRGALAAITKSYPSEARAEAEAQLGDAARAESGAALVALRCDAQCVRTFCEGVGAPSESVAEGKQLRVKTVRGGSYLLGRGKDQRLGIVWRTDELVRERRRAFAELSSIESNAKVYEQQKALK